MLNIVKLSIKISETFTLTKVPEFWLAFSSFVYIGPKILIEFVAGKGAKFVVIFMMNYFLDFFTTSVI